MEFPDESVAEKLRRMTLLDEIAEETFRAIAESAVVLRYSPGEYVWFEGWRASLTGFVWRGRIRVYSEETEDEVVAGQILGAEVITRSRTYRSTATAPVETILLALPLTLLLRLMDEDAQLASNIASAVDKTAAAPVHSAE